MIEYNKNNIPAARSLRKNMTPWEKKLWYQFLRNCPIRFQRQKAIGEYIVDFYCAEAKLVIELDGSQHYEEKGLLKDREREAFLKEYGITVLRIPNNLVNQRFRDVCEHIDNVIQQSLHR